MSPTVRVGEFSTLISNLVDQLTQRLAADDAPERLLVGLGGGAPARDRRMSSLLPSCHPAAAVSAGLRSNLCDLCGTPVADC